jgi:hypothetical protein
VRWKLLIITSLVAALINAGGMRALAYWLTGGDGLTPLDVPQLRLIFAFTSIPLIVTTLACVFVYRHTARRRKMQAALVALFALVLTSAVIFASRMFLNV